MKSTRISRKLVCMLLVIALLVIPASSLAQVGGEIGVTDVIGQQFIDYYGVVEQLEGIEALSNGAIDVYTLSSKYGADAVSEAGRELYVAKMGDGDRIIWIHAQIHGNERLTTHALLDFMWDYAGSAALQRKYAGLTIYAIPLYNPDGNLLHQRGTQIINDAGVITSTNFDLNRDWKLNMRGEGMGFQASESKAFYKLFCDIQPDFAYDLHHQGAKRASGSTSNNITGSMGISLAVDGPTLPKILDGKYNTLTKQIQKYIYDQVIDEVQAFSDIPGVGTPFGIDLYGTGMDIDILGGVVSGMMTGLNYDGLNPNNYSCPAAFFETETPPGTTQTTPIDLRMQKLIEQNYLVIYAFMDAQASGAYLNVNPDTYWDIPHYPVRGFSPDYSASLPEVDFSYLWPKVLSAKVSASIVKQKGNQNELTITIMERLSDKTSRPVKATFTIDNNASGTYDVGTYKVFVATKGNTQVRECYIA